MEIFKTCSSETKSSQQYSETKKKLFTVHWAHFYQLGHVFPSCLFKHLVRVSGENPCSRKNTPPDPADLWLSPHSGLVWSPQTLTGCFFICFLFFWQTRGAKWWHIDFVGNVVWYYPAALALHSCMVPIGVPASMRTRTQTVNHLCIF